MIYDRTAQDVEQAQEIFETKVKNFVALTEDEKTALERGRVTVDTLNRIEQKQAEIATMLKQWHYLKQDIANKTWSSGVFRQEDLKRLADNTKILRDCFYVMSANIANPAARFYYTEFNNMEKILWETSQLIKFTESSFKHCGSFNSNQIKLPLKGA
jgi:flagellar biosynthesis/type III secretory pathway chaperone